MTDTYSRLLVRRSAISLLAVIAALSLMLVTVTGVLADQVRIFDRAGVLTDQSRVTSEAATLAYPIDIYTTNTFTGSTSAFDQTTDKSITGPRSIVIAIDTVHKHLWIARGKSVPLSSSQYDSAVTAFRSSFGNGDYTGATVAAIGSLRSSLGGGNTSTPASGGGGILAGLLITLLIVLAIVGVIFFVVRGLFKRLFGLGRRTGGVVPYQQPYNQGYPPNYGPGYPPNYGPGYNQGVNPWVAGGLGAAGGGLIGYELGKEAGEREGQQGGDGGGDFGGGGGGDSGGGSF